MQLSLYHDIYTIFLLNRFRILQWKWNVSLKENLEIVFWTDNKFWAAKSKLYWEQPSCSSQSAIIRDIKGSCTQYLCRVV